MSTLIILLLTLGFAIFYCCIGAAIINTLLYIENHVSESLCEQLTLGLPVPTIYVFWPVWLLALIIQLPLMLVLSKYKKK
jgi:hypothetical protein